MTKKQRTVQEHYNFLRRERNIARLRVDVARGVDIGDAKPYLQERVVTEAEKIAGEDFDRLCSEVASRGDELPLFPRRYYTTSYFPDTRMGSEGASSTNYPVATPDYIRLALGSLLPELERELDRATAAFEAYRQAVTQGVAQSPPSDDR